MTEMAKNNKKLNILQFIINNSIFLGNLFFVVELS
jgi:hypothetical protein